MSKHTTQLALFTTNLYDPAVEVPYGYCQCGCGQLTKIPDETSFTNGRIKGVPMRFLSGHNGRIPAEERFWQNVDKSDDPDACWIWNGTTNSKGYGEISVSGHGVLSHRYSWELHSGAIPDNLLCLHKCDNPPCVRPDHLFLGTQLDNMRDMIRKGRAINKNRPGTMNGNAKLTDSDIVSIRSRYKNGERQTHLAREYGVPQPQISLIVLRKAWKHIP